MFRPLFAKILALFSAVAKCLGNLSENAKYLGNLFQKNDLEIEDRKSRKSKVAKYSKILADLPSEQIFTEITRWVAPDSRKKKSTISISKCQNIM